MGSTTAARALGRSQSFPTGQVDSRCCGKVLAPGSACAAATFKSMYAARLPCPCCPVAAHLVCLTNKGWIWHSGQAYGCYLLAAAATAVRVFQTGPAREMPMREHALCAWRR